ncbi:hypothetical protein CAEBREN_24053 [Caenorhabditis brenneri]|uniref:Uncharacterized protein n=1 Tax=Caenorhabditis brenneri TaxID=135651 RepID=G0PCG1_CAEBE|nr:hypothetical protein CAEBREN_24053 [Caenorhabditis brenneri]
MSSKAGSSENTDPNNSQNRSLTAQKSHSEPTRNRQQQPQQQGQPRTVGATPFKSFDMKQLTSEMKRLADSGKLFNVMREVDRRGGLRGLQGFCVARGAAGRRGGRRGGNNGKQQQQPMVAPDEPSTSGLNNY